MTDPGIYDGDYYDAMRGQGASEVLYKDFIAGFLNNQPLIGTVLDAGCGRGEMLAYLSSLPNCTAYGLDFSPEAVEASRKKVKARVSANFPERVICGSLTEQETFTASMFDAVFMMDIVEHLEPEQLAFGLRNIKLWLKPGGSLYVHTFPTKIPHYIYQRLLLFTGRRAELQKLNAIHCNVQSRRTLKTCLEQAGFEVSEMWLKNDLVVASSAYQNMKAGMLKSVIAWLATDLVENRLVRAIASGLRVEESLKPSIYAVARPKTNA